MGGAPVTVMEPMHVTETVPVTTVRGRFRNGVLKYASLDFHDYFLR